jgi:hypothetical protein
MLACIAAPVSGQQRANVANQTRVEQYKSMQVSVSSMPRLDAKSIDDVFVFGMENRHLLCHSPLGDGDQARTGQYRVEIGQFKGPTYVQISSVMGGQRFGRRMRPPINPGFLAGPVQMLSFFSYDMKSPEALSKLIVQSYPGYLHVERSTEIGDGGFRIVRLTQQRQSDGRGLLQLFFTQSGGDLEPRGLSVQAPDFYALLRDHPKEVDEHLRPLLRQFGQETVFAPDALIAWQVFSEQWKPDTELRQRIEALLPEMDEVDYHKRERVVGELEEMGRDGAAVLLHMDRTGFSPERNLLIDRALAPFAQLPPRDAGKLRNDSGFLLDCLYSADSAIRKAALSRLRQVTGRELQFPLDASESKRCDAVATLRAELLRNPTSRPATNPSTRVSRD